MIIVFICMSIFSKFDNEGAEKRRDAMKILKTVLSWYHPGVFVCADLSHDFVLLQQGKFPGAAFYGLFVPMVHGNGEEQRADGGLSTR